MSTLTISGSNSALPSGLNASQTGWMNYAAARWTPRTWPPSTPTAVRYRCSRTRALPRLAPRPPVRPERRHGCWENWDGEMSLDSAGAAICAVLKAEVDKVLVRDLYGAAIDSGDDIDPGAESHYSRSVVPALVRGLARGETDPFSAPTRPQDRVFRRPRCRSRLSDAATGRRHDQVALGRPPPNEPHAPSFGQFPGGGRGARSAVGAYRGRRGYAACRRVPAHRRIRGWVCLGQPIRTRPVRLDKIALDRPARVVGSSGQSALHRPATDVGRCRDHPATVELGRDRENGGDRSGAGTGVNGGGPGQSIEIGRDPWVPAFAGKTVWLVRFSPGMTVMSPGGSATEGLHTRPLGSGLRRKDGVEGSGFRWGDRSGVLPTYRVST